METFTKFEELKDIFENIISFTDNKTFCCCFFVSKKFKEICDKLKNKRTTLLLLSLSPLPLYYSYPLSSLSPLPTPYYLSLSFEIRILWNNDRRSFTSLNKFCNYKNERIRDEWIDSKLDRVLEIHYKENKLNYGFYYMKDKKDKDRYEFDFVNSKIILINNSKKYEQKGYIDAFVKNYKS